MSPPRSLPWGVWRSPDRDAEGRGGRFLQRYGETGGTSDCWQENISSLIIFIPIQGNQSWIIGIVEKGDRDARVIDKPRIIEVGVKGNVRKPCNTWLACEGICLMRSMSGAKQGEGRRPVVTQPRMPLSWEDSVFFANTNFDAFSCNCFVTFVNYVIAAIALYATADWIPRHYNCTSHHVTVLSSVRFLLFRDWIGLTMF